MPRSKRERRERTHDWQQIQQYTLWPEQQLYEKIRPVVLFGETAAEHAKEIGVSERTLYYLENPIVCTSQEAPRSVRGNATGSLRDAHAAESRRGRSRVSLSSSDPFASTGR